ncbi:hypothetical protein ACFSX5_09405 [Devosia albogilva]|uniref:Uncharacterized protein n=1 Tax=Devosia albogilva TaxID=429726 RepID=A0ABW5QJY3_9HYPH
MRYVPSHLRRRRRPLFRAWHLLLLLSVVVLTPKLDMGKFPLLASWLPAETAEQTQRG